MNNLLSNIRHNQNTIFKFVLVGLCISAISFILPRAGSFKYEYPEGKPWLNDDLIAPFDFPIFKTNTQVQKEEIEKRKNAKLYFRVNSDIVAEKLNQFEAELNNNWNNSKPSKNDGNNPVKRIAKRIQNRKTVLFYKEDFKTYGLRLLNEIYSAGILKIDAVIEDKSDTYEIVSLNENIAQDQQLKEFFTIKKAYDFIENELKEQSKKDIELLQPLLENALEQNVIFDIKTTKKFMSDDIAQLSLTRGMIKSGENIIRRGDIVSKDKREILDSFKREYLEQLGKSGNTRYVLAGQILLVSIMVLILVGFLYFFREDVYYENDKIAFILFISTLMVYLASMSVVYEKITIYVLPFCILPILMRTFFDVRLAIFTHIVTMIIIGFMAPNSFEFLFIQVVAGIASIYFIVNIRKRSQIFITSIIIFLAYSITYVGFRIIQEGDPTSIDYTNISWFGVSALITLSTYPLMYVFERTFNFITDVTLMELADTNSPLLRQLAEEAPGTFQHSLQVANLAEEATHKVGGNPLLMRTAALYHDIGKLKNPAFFIENQSGINPHDELNDPLRSSKIIVNHVIDGIEMAKKHRLPEEIIDFIRTHHGTSTTGYFYKVYKQQHPDEKVDRANFAYPGPTPFSKETSILMMADAVEAASRSLQKPNEESLRTLVETIIDHQTIEEQFINANITFKDISEIKKIFIKKLMNIYHIRIEYPK
ncbi:HDIG domain-containing protein [Flavobacteriales bacterium]|nr:HDIG domain-containing protein [Flavobacteriales bacterium]